MFLKFFSLSPAPTPAVACSFESVFQLACSIHSIFQQKIEAVNRRLPAPVSTTEPHLGRNSILQCGRRQEQRKARNAKHVHFRMRAAVEGSRRTPPPTIGRFRVPPFQCRGIGVARNRDFCRLPASSPNTAEKQLQKKLRMNAMRLVSIISFWNSAVPKFQN